MKIDHRWKSLAAAAAGVALGAAIATPASAQPGQGTQWLVAVNYGAAPQSPWHINMSNQTGMLVGLSPVAARISFGDGTRRTFEISHGEYEMLRGDVGTNISFDVRHDVLHTTRT